jgi:leucyl aminopeptidase
MEDMHLDMCGSANVLGIALALGRLRVKRNVVLVLGIAENAIGKDAYKPHAIMRSLKGLTVTNGNTDAEGRLVLADSLYAVQARHRPHTIIDMATLTGACMVALGSDAAGAFTNSKSLREAVAAAGAARGETLWPLPILAGHRAELTACAFADLKSTGGRYGGASIAAAFLEMFIGLNKEADKEGVYKPAFLHLDIAGPAMQKGAATGFGTLSVLEYLLSAPAGAAHKQDSGEA